VHHHSTIQINHQPDATSFQFIILTFIYSSTCFGRSPTYHQELNDCSSSLWFYLRIVVIAVLCSWSGRPTGRLTLYLQFKYKFIRICRLSLRSTCSAHHIMHYNIWSITNAVVSTRSAFCHCLSVRTSVLPTAPCLTRYSFFVSFSVYTGDMNAEYCKPSSSFPKMTQHDRHYYLSIKLTWRQFSVRACLVRMFKITISTMCREHRWFLYPPHKKHVQCTMECHDTSQGRQFEPSIGSQCNKAAM